MRRFILFLAVLPISIAQIPMDYDYLDNEKQIGNQVKIAKYTKENAEKTEKLIAELLQNGGKWMLRTYKGRYISGQKDTSCLICSSNSVTMNGGYVGSEPHWTIERKTDTKIVFKASTGKYMCDDTGPFTGVVKLVDSANPKCVLWTPVKNDDGSWSFKNERNADGEFLIFEQWLSAHRTDELVVTMNKNLACEKFWLESW